MKVKLLKPTYWESQQLKPGDAAEVDDKTGARWEKAGIAEKQVSKPSKNTGKE
jgi:hypothetical protein